MNNIQYLVKLEGISKAYPGVQALEDVDFELLPGEVHCLVGENGAGKSTLMRILSGAEQQDEGKILINGKEYIGLTPSLGISLGVSTIYQETDLVGTMTIANNIYLGHEPANRWGAVNHKALNYNANELLENVGVEYTGSTLVRDINTANKQLVQIAKALSHESKVLIMDEPGATLNDHELEKLFKIVRRLKSNGIGIIYISHRLNEVTNIGDRVTVLRQGEKVSTKPINEVTIPSLISDMVGKKLSEHFIKEAAFEDEILLSVRKISYKNRFQDISFDLRKGEVLGIAGLVGAGRSDLLNCIFGAFKPEHGEIRLFGEKVKKYSPSASVNMGLGLVPEDRRDEGLILIRSVDENLSLPIIDRLSPRLSIDFKKMTEIANKYVDSLNIITPSIKQIVENLSGGNQQKVVVGKWLAADTKVLLLDEPTRGIDVGAKSEIYNLINRLTKEGISIIMASSELPEIINMSDRILVMAEGRITKELPGGSENITQEEIMEYAVPQREIDKVGVNDGSE